MNSLKSSVEILTLFGDKLDVKVQMSLEEDSELNEGDSEC